MSRWFPSSFCSSDLSCPQFVKATTLNASTSLVINGSTPQTGIQGTDTNLMTAGTIVSGAGHGLCTDGSGGSTTSGCPFSGFSQIEAVKKTSSTCTVGSTNSYDTCTDILTWPTLFADTAYVASCIGVQPAVDGGDSSTNAAIVLTVKSYSSSTITVITQNNRGGGPAAHYNEIHCIGIHP